MSPLARHLLSPAQLALFAAPALAPGVFVLSRRGASKGLVAVLLLAAVVFVALRFVTAPPDSRAAGGQVLCQAGALLCLILGWIAAYGALRGPTETAASKEGDGQRVPSVPSPWVLAAFAFFLMSVAADMYDQLRMERARSSLARALSGTGDAKVMEVAALGLNVRQSPSADAPKAGLLGLGQRVGVPEMKDGWARLGEARWVNAVFLRPVGKVPVLSGVVSRSLDGVAEKLEMEITLSHHERSVFGRYRPDAAAEWKPLAGTHGQRPLALREEASDRRRIATLSLAGSCLDVLETKTAPAEGCTLEGEWKNAGDASVWSLTTTEPFRPLP